VFDACMERYDTNDNSIKKGRIESTGQQVECIQNYYKPIVYNDAHH
jgi:hypothetical protein